MLLTLTFALALISSANSQDSSIGCYVDGECLQSNFIGVTEVDGLQECHQFCLQEEGCNFFTFYRDSKVRFTRNKILYSGLKMIIQSRNLCRIFHSFFVERLHRFNIKRQQLAFGPWHYR